MTRPRIEDVARGVFGDIGTGLAKHSAARAWGATTQLPPSFHVATLWKVEPLPRITQTAWRNKRRAHLTSREVALLELLRPKVDVDTRWNALVDKVRDGFAIGEIREGHATHYGKYAKK